MASKRARILIAVACVAALLVVAAVLAGWQFFIHSHEGYFSPVFSPDRRSIYFIERRTREFVWGLGIEHFTPPAHAFVLDNRISLNRLARISHQDFGIRCVCGGAWVRAWTDRDSRSYL